MTTTDDVWVERSWLLGLCFRMLGTRSEAEDVVQETYLRWLRLGDEERDAIRVPAAWLRRVATRLCLDVMGSARARRERYVGDWLPEPLPDGALSGESADPSVRAVLDESVSMAMLVVLDRMTPAERVAFVLHDVFDVPLTEVADVLDRTAGAARQLASSARRRVETEAPPSTSTSEHREVVLAFQRAASSGDLQALTALLAPDLTLRSDGGGRVRAARNPLLGPDRVARFLLGILAKNPALQLDVQTALDGRSVLVLHLDGEVTGVLSLRVDDGTIGSTWFQVNPAKLVPWTVEDGQARR